MNLTSESPQKAPCFRGHVRKHLSATGESYWVSEVRTKTEHSAWGLSQSAQAAVRVAIAGASRAQASASAGAVLQAAALRQAA